MGKDAAAMCSEPTLREEGLPIIRGRTFTTAFTAPAFIRVITTEGIPTTDIILPTITNRPTTDGLITRGLLRWLMDGAGAERPGMDITATTISPTRCIRRRLSG